MLAARRTGPLTLGEVISRLNAGAEIRPPGTSWCYSNTGYYLAGHVVERASGRPLHEYVRSALLAPAGLRDVHFAGDPAAAATCAVGYVPTPRGFATAAPPAADLAFGSGDLYASARDLARWTDRLWRGDLLSEASRRAMATPAALADGRPAGYALGLFAGELAGRRELSHDGNSGGFSSQVAYYPEDELITVVLMNTERHIAEQLEKRVSRSLLGVPEPEPSSAEDAAAPPLAHFVGVYRYGSAEIVVAQRDSMLLVRTPRGRLAELRAVGRATFVDRDDPGTEYEFEASDGAARRFRVRRSGKLVAEVERHG
jgi:hypothetical protein